jgi:hypothetical protein
MDKPLAEQMLDFIEQMYLENTFLKAVYRSKGWKNMEKVLQEARTDPVMAPKVQAIFGPLRDRIREQASLEQVMQEFLRVVPAKKDVN